MPRQLITCSNASTVTHWARRDMIRPDSAVKKTAEENATVSRV
jgi:hypothetical protein